MKGKLTVLIMLQYISIEVSRMVLYNYFKGLEYAKNEQIRTRSGMNQNASIIAGIIREIQGLL